MQVDTAALKRDPASREPPTHVSRRRCKVVADALQAAAAPLHTRAYRQRAAAAAHRCALLLPSWLHLSRPGRIFARARRRQLNNKYAAARSAFTQRPRRLAEPAQRGPSGGEAQVRRGERERESAWRGLDNRARARARGPRESWCRRAPRNGTGRAGFLCAPGGGVQAGW